MGRRLEAVVIALAAGTCPLPLTGQLGTHGLEHVVARPRATVVAVTVRLPHGSADDEPGFEGTASLLGRVLEEQVTRDLPLGSGAVSVVVGRTSMRFTLLAPPDAWHRALTLLDSALFDAPLDAEVVASARASTLESLLFESGSPVLEYGEEAVRVLAPPGSPWARPVGGTTASVGAVTADVLERYRRANHRRERAALVVVGGDQRPEPPAAGPDTVSPPEPESPGTAPRPGRAWEIGDRIDIVRDVTSAWITVAYPAPRTAPRIELELLRHVLEEELDPTPPDPDRFSVDIRIEDAPDGPVLVVEAAVLPDAADRWEGRIRSSVARLAEEPMAPDFFRLRLRRFRAARVLAEGTPETLAARIAEDLHREGRARDVVAEIRALDAASLARAAKALGEPHVFRFGPDLGNDEGGRAPDTPSAGAAPPAPAYISEAPWRLMPPGGRSTFVRSFTWTDRRSPT